MAIILSNKVIFIPGYFIYISTECNLISVKSVAKIASDWLGRLGIK